MAISVKQNLVATSKYPIKCPYSMKAEYITVHNTYNDAPAKNEVNYMIGNNNEVSFHFAVDDIEVIQGIPVDRNAWHCGDGGGNGNRKSIGVEICYSLSGGARYTKAEALAIKFVAQLLRERGWGIDRVRTHKSWTEIGVKNGSSRAVKNCPHRILDEGRWNSFLAAVQAELNGSTVTPPVTPPPSTDGIGVVEILVAELNVRESASFDSRVVKTVKKGETYQTWGLSNGMYNVGGNQWVSAGPAYVKFTPAGGSSNGTPEDLAGKRNPIGKITTTANLNVRTKPSTDGDIIRTISSGDTWNIYEISGGWARVHDGWVSLSYANLTRY
ncbi:N-acetylmuramoyl-L-alanine amidase [Bacillus sp. SRB3LM]|uniref:N-acetylmuramoyl-L-alanine amidase n=1 Tax=Bacillus sp. SRB3LM TaxID=2608689 RepID=UPI0018C45098|nr:N-acetylmuramoyl-L-alanine amidase [Bacillus sp. SRB3LM]MBG0967504.1 SH3 domain-containing protein [Bacillus sp. SRB3LM]